MNRKTLLLGGNMKQIPLTQGKFALVDDDDFERLSVYKWCAAKKPRTFYATREASIGGKARTLYMHRVILGTASGIQVDHLNHNGLDNRRSNLRECNNMQNAQNRRVGSNQTGFKGVYWDRNRISGHKYIYAQIRINTKKTNLGRFQTLEAAAHAYDAKAKEVFGEFALLNFPEERMENEVL